MKLLHLGPWGYNMTNNRFYEVIKETKGTATIRRVGSRIVEDTGFYAGYESADPNPRVMDVGKDKNGNAIYKEEIYTIRKKMVGDKIIYRGSCGMHDVFTLSLTTADEKHYFNHND